MPDIPLNFRAIDYVTDLGISVRAMRAFVDVEFPTQAGTTVDNNIRLVLPGPAGGATGYLSVP